ncbi:MAG TPA: transporter substrate-binding domain-containing protein [Candidatus Binatia bacterium]|nr:transporter substrate-binding domain-containing protein [Candidatus Binatia bacterium]
MKFLAALLAIVSFAASAADADGPTLQRIRQSGELRVGTETGYMPFEMRSKSGEIVGFDMDIARLMARQLGVKLTLVNISWDGIVPALLTGKFDLLMAGMTITEERARRVDFADPYIEIGQSALIPRSQAGRVKSIKDLDAPSFKIVTKLGTTGEIAARKFLPHANLRTFETEAEAAMEVRNGRADALIYDSPFNMIFAARHKDSLVNLQPPFTREPLGWAVRKKDPAFVAWLNRFLARIKADGSYEALHRKWFESDAWLADVN